MIMGQDGMSIKNEYEYKWSKKNEMILVGILSFVAILTILFIVLKFIGIITLSWLAVMSPIWILAIFIWAICAVSLDSCSYGVKR